MQVVKVFPALLAVALLGACTGNLEKLKTASPSGDITAFNRALGNEYQALADFEANRMLDWPDAEHYAIKTLAAWSGQDVQPDEPASRSLPQNLISEAQQDREILVGLLNEGDWRSKRPELSARAQVKYDCWLEQLEEGWQTEHIAACRQDFLDAVAELLSARASAPMAQPAPQPAPTQAPAPAPAPAPQPMSFTVYFDFDSVDLSAEAQSVLRRAARHAAERDILEVSKAMGGPGISVAGHTDRAGANSYNQQLSEVRAKVVEEFLYELGVPEKTVGVTARGETNPAVDTGNGVRELANRRVVITVN